MKRKALLIGNTNGLPGVKIDLVNFQNFLKTSKGGFWFDNEIEIVKDPTLQDLTYKINYLKAQSIDYLLVVFSGHGGQERETILEINKNGEVIGESSLKNISSRQINIYDCCRCYPESYQEKYVRDSIEFSAQKSIDTMSLRKKYEDRIMSAIPQQISLYSCSINETSNDTSEGGVYIKSFLDSAKGINSTNYKLVGETHEEASNLTINYCTRNNLRAQHPDSILPKCLISQQLIISINPYI